MRINAMPRDSVRPYFSFDGLPAFPITSYLKYLYRKVSLAKSFCMTLKESHELLLAKTILSSFIFGIR